MQQTTCHIYGLFFFFDIAACGIRNKNGFPIYVAALFICNALYVFFFSSFRSMFIYNNKMSLEKIMYNEFILLLVHIFSTTLYLRLFLFALVFYKKFHRAQTSMLHDLQQYTYIHAGCERRLCAIMCVCVCVREKSQRVLCPEFCAPTKKKQEIGNARQRVSAKICFAIFS